MKKNMLFFKPYFLLLAGITLTSSTILSSCKKDKNDKPDKPSTVMFESDAEPSADNVETTATGHLTAEYDPATKKLSYTFTWSGLSGEIGGFHIHKGDKAVIINFKDAGYSTAVSGTFTGSSTLTEDAWITDLMAGKLYGQIHTAKFPGGEIIFPFTKKGSSGSTGNNNPPVY